MRLLHLSDLHFGHPSVPAQVEAVERVMERERFDVIVVSGDLSQRTRTREFTRARKFLHDAARYAPVFAVPGNHDVAWWMAPLGIGVRSALFTRYRKFIRQELEPELRVDGATIVGLNSAHGVRGYTLTTRPRDLSVVGAIRPAQWERTRAAFAAAPAGDLRVLVFHHNLLRGRLSNRWGLAARAVGIEQTARTGADLVLCGHDHEERVEEVRAAGRRFMVSTANTLSDRPRGGRPSSFNVIDVGAAQVTVATWSWSDAARTFAPPASMQPECFAR